MEDDEADEAGEDYGGGLVEEEVESFNVGVKPELVEGEHFSWVRVRGGIRIDRLSESGGLVVRVEGFLGMFWLFLTGVLGLRGVWRWALCRKV